MEELKPDVAYVIDRDYSEGGFICHECGWNSDSIPMDSVMPESNETTCPECDEPGVENTLETDSKKLRDTYEEHKSDDGWISTEVLRQLVSLNYERFDTVLNTAISNRNAYIVFERGESMVMFNE